jgi:hypothetical protein
VSLLHRRVRAISITNNLNERSPARHLTQSWHSLQTIVGFPRSFLGVRDLLRNYRLPPSILLESRYPDSAMVLEGKPPSF